MPTPTGMQGLSKLWGRAASAVDRLGPGSALGRYEILMPVAKGGMAAVWAARLQGTRGFQKIVAVKTMLPDVSDDPDFQSMFLDEARVAARIRHPNVVEILDLGEESDVLYLVMEWVDGETASTLQKAAKPLGGIPQRIVLRIASQICAGLHNAHELRDDHGALVDLVHRDISPANVLISTAGFVKIVDFGVAKSKGRLHVTRAGGVIKGKTPYLSPEQLGGLPIDRRSDIFSLGALLYVLSTGLHPFRAETELTTVENIALKNPLAPRELNESIHPEFDKIILKALEKDPANRFSTCAEMQRAIDQVASTIGEPTTDEDVAAFVRKAIGDIQAKRAQDLRDAIAAVDASAAANSEPRPPLSPDTQTSTDGVPTSARAAGNAAAASAEPSSNRPAGAKVAAISSPEILDEISFEEIPSTPPDAPLPRLIIAPSAQPAEGVSTAPKSEATDAPPRSSTSPKRLPLARLPVAKILPAAGTPANWEPPGVRPRKAASKDFGEDTAVDQSLYTAQRRQRLQFIVAGAALFCVALGVAAILVRGGEEQSAPTVLPARTESEIPSAKSVEEPPPAVEPAPSASAGLHAEQPTTSPPPLEPTPEPEPESSAEPPAKETASATSRPTEPQSIPATRAPSTRVSTPPRPTTRAPPKSTSPPKKKYNPSGI
jgi:eukaryotic-like serine/threonine-protein kinase